MEKEYSWKRTEETEADVADILYRLFEQWRQIAVCAVAAAVILGGFGWIKSQGNEKETALDTSQEIILTEEEERAVADAVRLEQETRDLEIYLDRSVLMQMDAYHKSRNIMLYCIDHVQIQELQAVTESYLNFVLNGGAADKLMELDSAEKTDKSCLAELITAYQKTYSSPYQVIAGEYAEGNLDAQSIFYVETAGRNSSDAEKRALELQKVIEKYSIEVQNSGGVFICKDKSALNKKKAKKFLNKWLRRNYYMSGREYPYKNVNRKIIAEEYMTDESGEELKDYKVFNFNGIPKMIQVDYDRFRCHKRNLYTTEWDYIPASIEFPTDPDHRIEKPQCLDQMLKLASVLSQGFAHLRTDFYVIENKIYFGEFTFYHGSGFETFTPEKFGFETGSWLALPGSEADLRMKERI